MVSLVEFDLISEAYRVPTKNEDDWVDKLYDLSKVNYSKEHIQ